MGWVPRATRDSHYITVHTHTLRHVRLTALPCFTLLLLGPKTGIDSKTVLDYIPLHEIQYVNATYSVD